MKKIFRLATNKYVLVGLFMLSWIIFFDRYNLFKRWDDEMEVRKLKQEREYYVKQIEEIRKKRDELLTNQETMERFARERYYMKKDNEEIYIVEDEKPKTVEEK